jgi:formate hydrogenlyase subunit 6/NADH:ubiquinone oxidoreductase subunit I
MKIGLMFKDVSQSLFKRPFTEKYPYVHYATPARLRGCLQWNSEGCTGCGLCAKDCPASAIEMNVLDRKAKRFVFTYHLDRCTFCAQCVVSCRQGCISMSSEDWELAALNREPFRIVYGDESDIEIVLAGAAQTEPEPAECE